MLRFWNIRKQNKGSNQNSIGKLYPIYTTEGFKYEPNSIKLVGQTKNKSFIGSGGMADVFKISINQQITPDTKETKEYAFKLLSADVERHKSSSNPLYVQPPLIKSNIVKGELLSQYIKHKYLGDHHDNIVNTFEWGIVTKLNKNDVFKYSNEENCLQEVLPKELDPEILNKFNDNKETCSFYCIDELCKGGELYDFFFIKLHDSLEDQQSFKYLEFETLKNIFSQLAEGIRFIHDKDCAHRDIKLENILLKEPYHIENPEMKLKIADFGLLINEDELLNFPNINLTVGSQPYCAPEVLEKSFEENIKNFLTQSDKTAIEMFQKTDIFSLGVVFYMVFNLSYPFKFLPNSDEFDFSESLLEEAKPIFHKINDDQYKFLIDLIEKMLCINPVKRINIDEVIRILKNDTNTNITFNIGGNLSLKNKTSQIFQGGKKKK